MSDEMILRERDGAIAIATLNRPDRAQMSHVPVAHDVATNKEQVSWR